MDLAITCLIVKTRACTVCVVTTFNPIRLFPPKDLTPNKSYIDKPTETTMGSMFLECSWLKVWSTFHLGNPCQHFAYQTRNKEGRRHGFERLIRLMLPIITNKESLVENHHLAPCRSLELSIYKAIAIFNCRLI